MALAPLREAADSMAKASTPEPFSSSRTSNWVARAGGLPAYVQHIAHDLMEKRGKSESNAIQMAIGIVKRWCRGGGNVDANTKAAACKAVSEWEAKKAGSHAVQHSDVAKWRMPLLADELAVRDAAIERVAIMEQQFGGPEGLTAILAVHGMLEEAESTFAPTLKRTASASMEAERHEVIDGGQTVGYISRRRGTIGDRGDSYHAHAVNGERVTDYPGERSRQGAVDALRRHLEEAPARVMRMGSKHLVAHVSGYGPGTYKEFPSEGAARYAAGLPAAPTGPERDSKVAALGEQLRFDLMTLSGLEIPPLRAVQEARRRDPFDLAESFSAGELRDFHGRWRGGGAHLARLTPASVGARPGPHNNRPSSRLRSDAQRRYEGGVARMSSETRKALLDAFTPTERAAAKQRQPTSKLDELYKHAESHHEQFGGILRTIAGKLGAEVHLKGASAMGGALEGEGTHKPHVLLNSMKGRERATVKVNGKYNGDASRLNDVVRGSVAVPHVDDLVGAIKAVRGSLPKGWTITAPENRYVAGRRGDAVNTGHLNGYRDIAVILRSPKGFNVELQITTTHMQRAKGDGHKLYERRRKIVENGVKRELTAQQAHEVRRIDEQAKAMYDRAYLQANRRHVPRAR